MLISKDHDKVFANVVDRLSETARECFPLPDDAEVADNLVSMANFLPLIGELIEVMAPEIVAEIGAYRGITTRALLNIANEVGFDVHVVDPALPEESDDARLTRFKQLSIDYLGVDHGASVFFIDGDHNYFTVERELSLIHQQRAGRPVLTLLHDVSWPCARRDMYYLPDTIPKSARKPTVDYSVLSVASSTLLEGDAGVPMTIPVAIEEAGDANGVLTAVEGFLSTHDGYEYIQLPAIFGLGVLWSTADLSDSQRKAFAKIKERIQWVSPFAATMELNRLILLARVNEAGAEWHKCQRAIAELTANVDRLSSELKAKEIELARLAEQENPAKQESQGEQENQAENMAHRSALDTTRKQ